MTIETMPDSVAELLEASASKEGGVAFRTSDPELLVDVISRRYLNPSASAFLASTPEEAASSVTPVGQLEAVLEGEGGFKIKISPSERLEGINLLVRAAANAKAAAEAAPQHSHELKGLAQNFTGAVGWLIEHMSLSPRAAVGVAGGALFVEMATACAKPPEKVYLTPDNRPTVTAPLPSETTAPTPTEAATPTQEVADTKQFEAQWVSEGYVEDLRYGGTYSLKEHEVGKEKREFIVYRVGFTEIWFDKSLATSLKDQVLLPNFKLPDSQDHIQSWGALVHALNIGRVVSENQYNYDPDWFSKFLKDTASHSGEKYILKAWRKVPNGNEMYEMGKVDPSRPVRMFLLPPALSADAALHTPGGKDAPWQLSFNYWQGFMDAKISPEGSLDIYYSNSQYTPTQILESFQAKDSNVSEDFLTSIAFGPVDFGSFSTFRSDRISSPISTIPNYYRALLSDFVQGGIKTYRFDRNLSFVTLSPTPTPTQ